MVLKIVIPATILLALIVGMFSIILPKVEANVEPSCELFVGNGTYDPHPVPNGDLQKFEEETNRVFNQDIPEKRARFDSIVCGTIQDVDMKPFARVAVQGLFSRNSSKPEECAVRFTRRDSNHGFSFGVLVNCPPSPLF